MANENKSTKYLLLESTNLDCVLTPLQTTQRIKYTCFDVSENFIVFGATSGGIYIFSRDPCHFLQLLPNKDGSLNNVSISPDERFIGFSTCRGIAVILERSTEGGSYLVSRSEEHNGSNITSLTWSDNSNQLYVADNTGQLSLINISLFINKSIFQLPSHIIIKLDSEIVQVSCCGELLLVSTQTRSYVCDTVKEQYKQVGTKLREGVFGASFIKYSDGIVKAFCARPGSRLWEVDTEGSVLCTHQFKQALTSGPSVLVSLPDNKIHKNEFIPLQDQSINFPYLFPVMNKYLFTFKQDSFYIFDPEKVELIVECNKYSDVVDARCVGNRIYTWNAKGSIREFTLTPVENCLINLYFRGAYSLCVEICETFVEYIEQLESNKLFMMSPLLGLSHHIDNLHLNNNLSSFFVNLNNCCNSKTFKFNLNYSLESSAKIPKDCDKSDTIFSCNNLISKTSNLVNEDGSCCCGNKTNEGVHSNCSDNKKNSVTYHDNNLHNNGYLESSSPYCSSDTSNSPDVSLACLSPSDMSASSVHFSKFNSEMAKYKTRFLVKKLDTFKDQQKPTMNGLNKVKNSLDPKDAAFINLSDTDDSVVVEGREVKKKNGTRMPTVDLSCVLNICDTISKSDNSCKVELFAQFLHHLYLIYNEFKTFSSNDKNYQQSFNFPLSKYLNDELSKEMEQCFYDVIYSGELVDFLKLLPDEFNKLPDTNVKHPEKLLSFYSESELQLDIRLSNLFFLIIDILNPFIILQLLDSVNLPCCFLSWNSILSSYQDHSFDITVAQELNTFSHWPLPVILNIIFLMLRLDQVESASYISKQVNISVKDACYLNFRLHLYLDHSELDDEFDNHTNKLFLTYLANLIKDCEEEVKGLNSETVRYIEDVLIQVCNPVVCDNCNFPIVMAYSLPEETILDTVGELLLNYYMKFKTSPLCESDPTQNESDSVQTDSTQDMLTDEISSLSKSLAKILPLDIIDKVTNLVKILPNIILKLIKSNYCEVVDNLEFIAQFNLLQHLETYTSKLNSHHWISLCEYYRELSEGFCCICHHDQSTPCNHVQWNTLANLMLHALGPAISIQILLNYSAFIPPGKLYLSFYRSTLLSHVLSQNTDETTYKDILKSYHQQFVKEPIDSQLSQIGVVSMWEGDSNETAPSIVQSKDKKHWGITLDINDDVCSKCSVVLNSQVLQADGLRSFKCGHTYHVICLRLSNSLFQCSICS